MFSASYKEENQKNYLKDAKKHDSLSLNSTLYLAYRDLNEILSRHLYSSMKSQTIKMLDFGCGTGFSTEIYANTIQNANFKVEVTAVDINQENLKIAQEKLPQAEFKCILDDKNLNDLGQFNLIICNFVLVEMHSSEMVKILSVLRSKLAENGVLIVTNTTARAYRSNQWYSFNNQFSENTPTQKIKDSNSLKFVEDQPVKVEVFTATNREESFTFHDYFHSGTSYKKAYIAAGLKLLETHKPIGKHEDKIDWKAEKEIPPYKLHVLSTQL